MKRRFVRELRSEYREPVYERSSSSSEGPPGEGAEAQPARRGRKAIPLAWTRVMKVVPDTEIRVSIHTIDAEINR